MPDALAPLTLSVHTVGSDRRQELVADVRAGLGTRPRRLAPRWFYDEQGSRLFDRITELPEYYQTRTEAAILDAHAAEITALVRPVSLVELGAGSCAKSRILIAAGRRLGTLTTFVPFDISETAVHGAARELLHEYPELTVHAMVGDFSTHLDRIPRSGRRLVVFLGGTIGNFEDGDRHTFLTAVRGLLEPDDALLIGFDLVKPEAELVAAYDDAAGMTAAFNLNILEVLNRELDADLDPATFAHVARWDAGLHRMEMHLRSLVDQTVTIPAAGMRVRLEAGELIRTEISVKFTRELVDELLEAAGMAVERWLTDPAGRFAMALARPR